MAAARTVLVVGDEHSVAIERLLNAAGLECATCASAESMLAGSGGHGEGEDQSKFPIGTQGRAAIYTNPASWFVILRKIGIRTYTWFNWLYPFSG